jgi:hypothetical protein
MTSASRLDCAEGTFRTSMPARFARMKAGLWTERFAGSWASRVSVCVNCSSRASL